VVVLTFNPRRQRQSDLCEFKSILVYRTSSRTATAIQRKPFLKKPHTVPHTIIVGDFNTPLSAMDKSWEHKLDRDTLKLTEVMDQMDLTDIYRTVHPKTKGYTFFSAPHGVFSKIDHIIGYKTGLNRCKKTEIIPCTPSDHDGLRLVFNSNKNNKKPTHTWNPYLMITWSRNK
jgi:endonuclease/exonuclease/phosphatase family metal-dependent hydrolase